MKRGDMVTVMIDGHPIKKAVQHLWEETAEGTAKRGPMVTVYYGGGTLDVPESELVTS